MEACSFLCASELCAVCDPGLSCEGITSGLGCSLHQFWLLLCARNTFNSVSFSANHQGGADQSTPSLLLVLVGAVPSGDQLLLVSRRVVRSICWHYEEISGFS